MEDDVASGHAEEADVKLDPEIKGGVDGYINDGAAAVLDSLPTGEWLPEPHKQLSWLSS